MPSSAASRDTYSAADRFLHRIGLGSRAVMETSFDIETAMFGRKGARIPIAKPVFVCGLARAGTSLVTRLLEGAGDFATPVYRDMPFPLAPNLWSRLSGGKNRRTDPVERAHNDGLTHDLDSPEAIEEVFWRCFEGERYITDDGLRRVAPAPETLDRFKTYVRSILLVRGKGHRYLSKNNNNVLRLKSLADLFEDACFIHPFRHPLEQAQSLLRQHLQACALQKDDAFRRNYMRWLGHHEFGFHHRRFLLDGATAPDSAPDSLEYWLHAWANVYRSLLAQDAAVHGKQVFLNFDALVSDPDDGLGRLWSAANVSGGSAMLLRQRPWREPPDNGWNAICGDVYHSLLQRVSDCNGSGI